MHHRILTVRSTLVLAALSLAGCGGGSSSPAPTPDLTFGAPRVTATNAAGGTSFAIGDVDRDGFADVIVANPLAANVSILSGLPDGGLSPGFPRTAPAGAGALALADIDGDRQLDLVAASRTTSDYSVTPNVGNRNQLPTSIGGAMPWPTSVVVLRDVSGDGRVDLVAGSATATEMAVLLGDGTGAFGTPAIVALAYLPSTIVAADFDGDDRIDLVTTGSSAATARVDVWRSTGGGAFAPVVTTGLPPHSGSLAVADFDADGRVDIAAATLASGELLLLRGEGGGSFAESGRTFLTATAVHGLAAGDVDGDGLPDVVAAARTEVLVAYGARTAWRSVVSAGTTGLEIGTVAVHDLSGDGRSEAVFLSGGLAIAVVASPRRTPAGLSIYGWGTPDCQGRIGMWANGSPRIGNADYRYLVTNAPPDTFGFLLQGGPADVPGSDPFAIGVLLHIDLGFVTTRLVFSDAAGGCVVPEPVPNDAGLVGLAVYVQTLWNGVLPGSCAQSPLGISSSIGLTSTVQP